MPEELIVELSHICVFVLLRMHVLIFPCLFFLMASETLSGVTQLKIGDFCLLASEWSKRDSIMGRYEYMDMCVRMVRMPLKCEHGEPFS